jgi:chromosome partitioning protein
VCESASNSATWQGTLTKLLAIKQVSKAEVMKTVAVVSQKGGTSKSTLAVHLATASECEGRAAVVLDIDPHASAMAWRDLRQAGGPTVESVPYSRLGAVLKAASKAGAQLAIIDTPAASENAGLEAVRAADFALVPSRPNFFDTAAMNFTANLLKLAGKPGAVVFTQIRPPANQALIGDVTEAARGYGLPVSPVLIHWRSAFEKCLPAGLTAQEDEPKGKAAAEIAALYTWIKKMLAK